MIEIIIVFIVLALGFFTMTKKPYMTPTPTPAKRVRFQEPIMSHAMTNHGTVEIMRRKAELSRNNNPGNEFIRTSQHNWPPSVNS